MKKYLILFITVMLLLMCAACSGCAQQNNKQSSAEETTEVNATAVTTEPQLLEVTEFNSSFQICDSEGNVYITSDDIKLAKGEKLGYEEGSVYYVISIELTEDGTQKFADATASLVGESLEIIVDGETISSPVVNDTITDGRMQIMGDLTLEQVNDILLKMQG